MSLYGHKRNKDEDRIDFTGIHKYKEVFGRHFPAMSVIEVKSLLEDRAKVEIEATAVIP